MQKSMNNKWRYHASDSMSELVEGNYRVLLAMSRFGIGLGFGESTIDEVCAAHGVDTETFLAVVNLMLAGDQKTECDTSRVSPTALLDYLTRSHEYFVGFRLPTIRASLVEVLDNPADELSKAVVRYFDEYVAEVRRHTGEEDKKLFPYVRALMRGERGGAFRPDGSPKKHEAIQARLAEFKRTLIKYYPSGSTNRLNGVLFDIYTCEHDLAAHNRVEDRLLFPIIMELERKTGAGND